jgi:valyl-tRNA synthetase
MMGIHFMGDVPFKKVYLHAMVRDEKGEKMSKSKGNVIDPLVLIQEHGADPLRFTLAAMAGQGRDIKLSVDRVEGYRAFANKLWNATKFFHMQFQVEGASEVRAPVQGIDAWISENRENLAPASRWILSRLQKTTRRVEQGLAQFELNEAAGALYEFTWKELCDWYIEFSKIPLKQGGKAREESVYVLGYVLERTLRLLHPIMPFVTEELWQSLPWKHAANTPARIAGGKPALMTLMFQRFPEADPLLEDDGAERTVAALQGVIEGIRTFRGENNVSPKVEFAVRFSTEDESVAGLIDRHRSELLTLARIQGLERVQGAQPGSVEAVLPLLHPKLELRIGLQGLVNVEEETKRLHKEMEKVRADLEFVRAKLTKESFISKAPPELVAKEKQK